MQLQSLEFIVSLSWSTFTGTDFQVLNRSWLIVQGISTLSESCRHPVLHGYRYYDSLPFDAELISAHATYAPSAAYLNAIARPIPDEAPVTIATLFKRRPAWEAMVDIY